MTQKERFEVFIDSELLSDNLYRELMWIDVRQAIYATLFVFVFFIVYLNSVFLALVATQIIIFSFPLTGIIVQGIFGVTYFGQMEILIYFVLLGTSADDIFLVYDRFRESETLEIAGRKQIMSIK